MTLYDIFPNLNSIPIFSKSSSDYVNTCFPEDTWEIVSYESNELIYSSESTNVRIGLIIKGSADIQPPSKHSSVLLKTATAGDLFGIANLYATDEAFPTVIYAKERVSVLFLNPQAFQRFIENDPNTLHFYLSFLSEKIVYLNRKIAIFTAGSAEHRLAYFLWEHQQNGRLTIPRSMTTFAEILGLGRASLYRAMDKLLEWKWILRDHDLITIIDEKALAHFLQTSL